MTAAGAHALRIFLVEDDPDTREYFTMLLEDEGYAVRSASNFDDALRGLADEDTDVLVSDIGLPDRSGWLLPGAITAEGIAMPLLTIAVSGYGASEDRSKSLAAGFGHHLLKPFRPEDLLRLLERAAAERDLH